MEQTNLSKRFALDIVQDYPSLGHINYVAKEHSVNLVWAVTGEHLNLYKRLTQVIININIITNNIIMNSLADDLYQRGRPDIFRLEQCRGIGNSFDFHT